VICWPKSAETPEGNAVLRDLNQGFKISIRCSIDGDRFRLTAPRSLHARVAPFLAAVEAPLGRTLVLEAALVSIDSVRLDEIRSAAANERPGILSAEERAKVL
jgi:hypothetical protein